MAHRMTIVATAVAAACALAAASAPGQAQQTHKFTLFGQPSVNNDAVWMAFEKGFYRQEGLDITYRLFPSGTTAFQTFQTGQGDIVLSGDLPSVQYFFRTNGNYRTIAALERDTKGYVAVAQKAITKPQDLVGKTIATRVGSTGSWFISEYLAKNGIDPTKVTVKNLDTQVMPAALCGGEIAAFFVWQPIGSRALEICGDKAHYLTDAGGYIQGYLVAGARPDWLASPDGKEIATRWLRATLKGKEVAEKDFASVAAYAKAKLDLSEKATREQYDTMTRPIAIDKVYYDDFCSLSRWAQTREADRAESGLRQADVDRRAEGDRPQAGGCAAGAVLRKFRRVLRRGGPYRVWALPADQEPWSRVPGGCAVADPEEVGRPREDQPARCDPFGKAAARRRTHRSVGSGPPTRGDARSHAGARDGDDGPALEAPAGLCVSAAAGPALCGRQEDVDEGPSGLACAPEV